MSKSEGPNIVLVAIDTLRADHLGCYGYSKQTSPNIDGLASEGVLFENCIAPGIPTHPGFTTIFTGMHPLSHEIVCHAGNTTLSWDIKMLPEILSEKGYLTVAVDNLVATRGLWFVRGFEYYIFSGGVTVISKGAKITGEIVTRKALNFLRSWREGRFGRRPFFLFVHYWDPHTPYLPPQGFRERLYDEEILYADWCLGKLLEELKYLELYDDTVIILTSDHGEGLGENGIFYDHHGLYEWDIRIPLIIRAPQVLPPGKRVKELITHEDIMPTILELIGVTPPKSVDGHSLIPLIEEQQEVRKFVVCLENTRMTKRAIRTRRWKLIETLRHDIYGNPPGYIELYDLEAGEERNVYDENRDVASELMLELERWYVRKLQGKPDPLVVQPISLPVPP